MAKQDQLEIISPSGEVSFVGLNSPVGISNIGRHPDNDIVINSPTIGLFHAILDHRQKPFKIVMLQPDSQSTLSGSPLPPSTPTSINSLDTLVLGGFLVIPFEGPGGPSPVGAPTNGAAVAAGVAGGAAAGAAAGAVGGLPPVAVPGSAKDAAGKASGLAGKIPGAGGEQAAEAKTAAQDFAKGIKPPPGMDKAQGLLNRLGIGKKDESSELASDDASVGGVAPVAVPPMSVARLGGLPSDINDETIITEMETRQWAIDVGLSITATITIANGGDLVASFDVAVEGIDPTWLVIAPVSVNLNEGQKADVNITIMPPRLPSSSAGKHFFAVHVTSSNYPGHASQRGATLIINPYYEFAIGELSPREQSIGFRKHNGQVSLPIVNRGNSETAYKLEGEDNERGCSFEFVIPGTTATLARQAELSLPANVVTQIPIRVTPHHRRLIALRNHSYSLTVTTTPHEGQLTPRSVLGQLHASPLIGKWTILFSILTAIALFVIIFRPGIDDFRADRAKVLAKQPVNLTWHASPFSELHIDNVAVAGPSGSKAVVPDQQRTTYHLTAENILTRINAQWFGASKDVVVEVVPVLPEASFAVVMPDGKRVTAPSANALPILHGESVTLYWEVANSEKLILSTNGANETIPATDVIGKRVLQPDKDTVYSLDAQNQYGDDTKLLAIKVNEPPTVTPTPTLTPTPIPAPVVVRFDIVPLVITAGQQIQIDWEVLNADTIVIQGIPGTNQFPPKGSIKQAPDKSTSYVLTAVNGPNVVPLQRDVIVNPAPTPTATPVAPRIVTFQLTRTDVVHGSPEANDIQLIWLVTGDTTNITISGPDLPAIANQPPQGQISIIGTKPTLFVITAMNGALLSSQTVNLNVTEPTPTPTPPPTATPLPPAANITQFQADSASGNPSDVQIALGGTVANTTAYTVVAGTSVKISWAVDGATTVLLGAGGGDSGVGPTGNTLVTLKQPATYSLKALNSAQMQTVRYIQFNVVPQKAPPAPTGVNGVSSAAGVTVTWSYAQPDKITGFRVYRATVPSTNYARVGFETQLNNTTNKFNDTTAPFCGTSYYVVGVYLDLLSNSLKETDKSAPVWYSKPCGT